MPKTAGRLWAAPLWQEVRARHAQPAAEQQRHTTNMVLLSGTLADTPRPIWGADPPQSTARVCIDDDSDGRHVTLRIGLELWGAATLALHDAPKGTPVLIYGALCWRNRGLVVRSARVELVPRVAEDQLDLLQRPS